MFKSLLKYFFVFLISVAVVYQFQEYVAQIRLIPTGYIKSIFPEKKTKPVIEKINDENKIVEEILRANSFNVSVIEVNYFSGYNKNKDGTTNFQLRSAALYASNLNNETLLELYTRNGFLITKDDIVQFDLPNNYDSHNSHGGIRGVFFIDKKPYGFMATKNIGCQNMSIVNLQRKKEIFQTDCLPDFPQIHYDGIGGASIHHKKNILLSIGAPTNYSPSIRGLAQNNDSYYGKIVSIDKASIKENLESNSEIEVKIFTSGHRNPQGLAKINDNIFSAEHGPKGGDELNILNENANYGWPVASYGTKYESKAVATYKLNHLKNNFIEPLMQFTPSIAISDLVNCTDQMIKYYDRKGCLLATALRDQSLVIILLSNDFKRVIGYEKIKFRERLRHFAKKKNGELFFEDDGSIYITADSGKVLKIGFKLVKE